MVITRIMRSEDNCHSWGGECLHANLKTDNEKITQLRFLEKNNIRFWIWSFSYLNINHSDQTINCGNTVYTNGRVMVDAVTGILQQTRDVCDLTCIGIVGRRSCARKRWPICQVWSWYSSFGDISYYPIPMARKLLARLFRKGINMLPSEVVSIDNNIMLIYKSPLRFVFKYAEPADLLARGNSYDAAIKIAPLAKQIN